MSKKEMHPSVKYILQFFKSEHLPGELQFVANLYCELATQMACDLPGNPELIVGLLKLLEAKDCFIHAKLAEFLRTQKICSRARERKRQIGKRVMNNPIYTYNPKSHITADKLRDLGFAIPNSIPGAAFIPKDAAKFDIGQVVTDGDLCGASFQIYMSSPFRWIEKNVHKRIRGTKKVPKV